MHYIPVKKQTNPIAKLLWKLVLGNRYENPDYIENRESTYVKVSPEFETLVWQNGDEFVETSFYVEKLVKDSVSQNTFEENLVFSLMYFKNADERHEKITEYESEVESEFGVIEDYNILYDKATEMYFNELIQNTKRGKIPEEVEEWLQSKCLAFTTEFSEADCLTLEEIQEVVDSYCR